MKRRAFTVILILILASFAIHAVEQSIFSAGGVIESTTGGFKFPDGSVQSSAAFPASSQCTAVTGPLPLTIDVEGVYCLTGDLTTSMATGVAITINADNVTINMNGWILDGLGAGPTTSATGIHAYQRKNVTIRNGTIRGFFQGIFLEDLNPFTTSQAHIVEDIRAIKNTLTGINVQGESSIVRRNQVADTGGASGGLASAIVILGPGTRAIDNDVSRIKGLGATGLLGETAGLTILFADGAVVEGNRIADVMDDDGTAFGIWISESEDVLAAGNRITGLDIGIEYDASVSASKISSGKYMDNLTSDVTTPFMGGDPVGTNS